MWTPEFGHPGVHVFRTVGQRTGHRVQYRFPPLDDPPRWTTLLGGRPSDNLVHTLILKQHLTELSSVFSQNLTVS